MNKLFCLLALALNIAFATHTLAILPSDGTLSDDELDLLTDKMREAALNVLPLGEFTLLKQDVVIKRLGGMESYMKECSETSCIVNLGKKAQVDYVAQCRVGKLGDDLRITVELYEVSTGGLLGMFSDVADGFSKLPPMMDSHIPDVFRNITAPRQEATEPVAASVATSNAWNDWFYGEYFYAAGGSSSNTSQSMTYALGVRYERKLSSKISVGGGFYFGYPLSMTITQQDEKVIRSENTFGTEKTFKDIEGGIDAGYFYDINAFFRLYPWGKMFYLGTALGYHRSTNYIYSDSLYYYDNYGDRSVLFSAYESGFAITPEIGWKIDIGEDGGFCINIGINLPIIIGKATPDAAYFYDGDSFQAFDDDDYKVFGASDDKALSKSSSSLLFIYLGLGYAL